MKTIKTVIMGLVISGAVVSCAQPGAKIRKQDQIRNAEFAHTIGDYHLAYKLFNELMKTDSLDQLVSHRTGACLLNLRTDKPRAGRLIEYAVNAGRGEALFDYGRWLQLELRFEEAIDAFNRYGLLKKTEVNREKLDRHIAECQRGIKMKAKPVDVVIRNVGEPVNTEWKEYAPLVTADGMTMYFASRRPGTTAQLKDPNGEYFEDIYMSEKNPDTGQWGDVVKLPVTVNSELNDAPTGLSSTGNTLIFFRTNENLRGGDLFLTRKRDGQWTKPERLPASVNTDNRELSACISPDGNFMIFSSDRPGGFGGMDLYVVRKLPNGLWSRALNLGPVVNTPGDEDAPFLSDDSMTLYFASNGHPGMGGYDLFKSYVSRDFVWSVPENMGFPINTPDDDVFLCMYDFGRKGYFSSDRKGGKGLQDIYSVEFVYRHKTEVIARGTVTDNNGEPLGATITLLDEDRNIVAGTYNTNYRNGKFILVVNPMVRYRLIIEADDMATLSDYFSFDSPLEPLTERSIGTFKMEESR
jgi:hypothetical protein